MDMWVHVTSATCALKMKMNNEQAKPLGPLSAPSQFVHMHSFFSHIYSNIITFEQSQERHTYKQIHGHAYYMWLWTQFSHCLCLSSTLITVYSVHSFNVFVRVNVPSTFPFYCFLQDSRRMETACVYAYAHIFLCDFRMECCNGEKNAIRMARLCSKIPLCPFPINILLICMYSEWFCCCAIVLQRMVENFQINDLFLGICFREDMLSHEQTMT